MILMRIAAASLSFFRFIGTYSYFEGTSEIDNLRHSHALMVRECRILDTTYYFVRWLTKV